MCKDLKECLLSHLRMRSGSRKIIKRCGCSVSPCMAPLVLGLVCLLKYSSMNHVVYCE